MKRALRIAAASLLGIAVLIAGVVWWATSTEAGARRVFGWLGAILKGSVEVARVEGPIRGPLTVYGLKYRTPSLEATVDRARLDWRLSELLRKRLDIVSLRVEGVRVVTRPTPEKKAAERLPDLHLPVNVIVRDAEVSGIRFGSDPQNALVIDSVSLKTSAIGDTVRVDRLVARGPMFSADASGTVRPRGDYPVDLRLAWSARLPKAPLYAGAGTFTGTLERLTVNQTLESPFRAAAHAVLTAPMRDLRFAADLSIEQLSTARLQPGGVDADVSGAVHAEGALDAFSARGDVGALVRTNQLGRVRAVFTVARQGDRWNVDALDIALAGTPTRLRARGRVDLAGRAPAFDLAIGWERIAWPLRGAPLAASPAGEAKIAGTVDAYTLDLSAAIEGPKLPRGNWRLDGHGDRRKLELASFRGDLLSGNISGKGLVGWQPSLSWNFEIEGAAIDPEPVLPGYPGRLGFTATSAGRMEKSGAVGFVDVPDLSGTLRQQPVAAKARVEMNGPTIRVTRGEASVADARLTFAGQVAETLDAAWTVEVPELSRVLAGAAGSVSGRGNLGGHPAEPRIRATVTGRQLAAAGHRAARLDLDADVDLSSRAPSRANLRLTGFALKEGARRIDQVTAALSGDARRHSFAVDASSGKDTFHLAVAGGLEQGVWRGDVTRLDLASAEAGRWALAAPAAVVASRREARVGDFCWVSGRARLCAAGTWRKAGATDVRATVTELPLALFSPWLPPDIHVEGNVNGRLAATAAAGGLRADVSLTAGPGNVRYTTATGEAASFEYHDTRVEVAGGTAGIKARATAALGGIGGFSAEIDLPQYGNRSRPLGSQPMGGTIRADLSDVGFVRAFATSVDRVGGAFHADVTLSGTVGTPRFAGQMRLENGRATLPDYGLTLSPVALTAAADARGALRVDGTIGSGGGTLRLAGTTGLPPSAAEPLDLSIQGTRFEAYGTDEARVWVSPDLRIHYDGRRADLNGDVTVPETKIDYKQRFATIEPSKDVVLVGRDESAAASTKKPIELHARVRLVLGDRVDVKGMGFDGRVTGSLLALENPGRPTAGTGELVITKGTYKAYGQDLTVEHGRLRFAGGPIDNPGLDLRAYRKTPDGTTAGVDVKGTLKNPALTLYSDPAMSQGDALAYLILGHPLNQNTTKQEGSLVERAAASLGIAGGNLLGKKFAKQFGFETARIETHGGNLQEASLVVGKFLSPKLYVEYGLGLFDQASMIRIEYILSKKWTLRAETGENNGADVLYTIERGKSPPPPRPTPPAIATEREVAGRR